MKIYLFFAILITGFSLAIIAAYKPDAIAAAVEEAETPVRMFEKYQAEKEDEELGIAYQQDKAIWLLRHPLPTECTAPSSNLKILECKNRRDLEIAAFRKAWREAH